MKNKNEQGFALVLSLVLLLAMSLMGGALIVISAGDHQSNNTSDEYQQTFYVAEAALIEGEKYLLNQYLGPWNTSTHKRDTALRNLPSNGTSNWNGRIVRSNRKNYTSSSSFFYDTSDFCYNSFKDIDKTAFKIVVAESWNFGQIIRDSFNSNASTAEQGEADKLKKYSLDVVSFSIYGLPSEI